MNVHSVVALLVVAFALRQPVATPQSVVDELLAADRAFSASALKAQDLASGLGGMFADDVVMQVPGNRLIEGRSNAVAYLRAAGDARGRAEWTPVRGGVSADGRHGFTFGYMTVHAPDGSRVPMKYMGYWVKGRASPAPTNHPGTAAVQDGWRVVVYKRRPSVEGDSAPRMMEPALPARLQPPNDSSATERFRASLDLAERAFSRDAQTIGIGAAFAQYGSSDAVNMGGPKAAAFIVGAEAIGRTIGAAYPPGASPVSWAPDKVIVASSGDLGVTIGWIRPNAPAADRPAAIPFFTIWRRESPSDAWRYVAE